MVKFTKVVPRESFSDIKIQVDLPETLENNKVISDYNNKTFLERRQDFCDWIVSNSDWEISWTPNNCKYIRDTQNVNYSCSCKFYKLHYGYDEYPDAESYNGLNFDKEWTARDCRLCDGDFEFEKGKTFEENLDATLQGCIDLIKAGIHFSVFYAEGMRTPHIHCYNLFPDIKDLAEKELTYLLFTQKVFSIHTRHLLDLSLAGEQIIALEFSKHWKTGKMKKLLFEHIPGGKDADK